MNALISKIPIQMSRNLSRVINDEIVAKRAEGYVFQFYTPEKQQIKELTLEVSNYRLRMYSRSDQLIYFEVMLEDMQPPVAETQRVYLLSTVIYKIVITVPRLNFRFDIKRDDKLELSKEFQLLQEAFGKKASLQGVAGSRGAVSYLGSKLEEQRREFNQAKVSSEAGTDSIDLLFKNFEELKDVFQKLNSIEKDQVMNDEVKQMMRSLGQANLVAKSGNSQKFSRDLAGEIDRVLGSFLERNHGIISTIEAFSLYSSLRGVSLVTPEEFISACELLKSMNSKVELERMPNGVMILRLRGISDQAYFDQKLLPLLHRNRGQLTQESLGVQLNISISLARILLDTYLRFGLLCLDDHIEGRTYFANEIKKVKI